MICQRKKYYIKLAPFRLATVLVIACFFICSAPKGSEALDNDDNEINDQQYGSIGCLFADRLCNVNENCFDDNAFGKCIDLESAESENFYRYEKFSEEASDLLEQLLNKLKRSGFSWSDQYSQCVMQSALASIRFNSYFDSGVCKDFLEDDDSVISNLLLEKKSGNNDENEEQPVQKFLKVWTDDLINPHDVAYKELKVLNHPDLDVFEERDGELVIDPNENGVIEVVDDEIRGVQHPDTTFKNREDSNIDSNDKDAESEDPEEIEFEAQQPESDTNAGDENTLSDATRGLETPIHLQGIDSSDIFNRHKFSHSKRSQDEEEEQDNLASKESPGNQEEQPSQNQEFFIFPSIGDDSGLALFNRNERLDVKKPGPFFPNSENNFFLNKILAEEDNDSKEEQDESILKDPFGPKGKDRPDEKGQIEFEDPLATPVKDKRLLKVADVATENDPKGNDFVHIYLNKRLQTWLQGADMILHLANELGIPEEALTNRLIEDHHVQFRVEPNPKNINAEAMADLLGQNIEIKKRIADKLDVDIENVLAGQQHDLPNVFYKSPQNFYTIVGLAIACVSVTGLLISVATLVLIKKRRKMLRLKQNLMEQEEEDSRLRDQYSQLCRDWSNTSKPTSGHVEPNNRDGLRNAETTKTTSSGLKKMTSRESSKDLDTSNRAEELTASNMDISTGHMVLAYMEDHLKNKQRLEQEWVALCGYEAEPCATTVAFKPENKKKNRYPDKLPYDHNRVILNALQNINNSDYINASTVTDHDPRNPPYIVSQGPLSQTVADFWQMVWEQGCVVIVMLTRLQDNGYHLCHRYWPEEGSEKYHNFEVHLVSEHVWCDDYLVRSVYLKNTRTGETRTVTQFHFRSWPAHGVPTSTKALLEFRRKVNKSYRGRSCPIIVHCSDGVGRAGTYTLIDMVLNRMAKGCKEIDIAATLEHIRDQRGGMVQTRQQFEFCLMAVAEEVHAILKALPQ